MLWQRHQRPNSQTNPSQAETVTHHEKLAVVLLVVILVLLWNWQFVERTALSQVLEMNDVEAILIGYRQTPNLVVDGLRWWHGPWIENGISVFRPISSYFLWIESWIGLKWGFVWVAWIGVFIFAVDCLLTTALAWRFSRSKPCALLAAVLAPAMRFWNWGGSQPDYWLAWYPAHHDLLMIGFLLSALLAFDLWLETARKKHLVLTWTFFVLGALSKEFLYIFPLMAGALVMGKPHHIQVRRKEALWQVGALLAFVVILFCYRMTVLSDPYNPPRLKTVHLIRKPFLYWFPSFYKYIPTEVYWYPGLALLLFSLTGAFIKFKHSRWKTWLSRPFAWLPIAALVVAILCAYCTVAYSSPVDALWYVFDWNARTRQSELIQMTFNLYTLYLVWKYRKEEPTLATFALFILSYAPVFTYLGWHYCITGWFIRSAIYWPVIAKLVWLDTGRRRWSIQRQSSA